MTNTRLYFWFSSQQPPIDSLFSLHSSNLVSCLSSSKQMRLRKLQLKPNERLGFDSIRLLFFLVVATKKNRSWLCLLLCVVLCCVVYRKLARACTSVCLQSIASSFGWKKRTNEPTTLEGKFCISFHSAEGFNRVPSLSLSSS